MSYDNLSSVSQNVLKFYQQLTCEERRIPFILGRNNQYYFGYGNRLDRCGVLTVMLVWNCSDSMIFWNCSDRVIFWNCSDCVIFWNCSDSVIFWNCSYSVIFWNCSDSVIFWNCSD